LPRVIEKVRGSIVARDKASVQERIAQIESAHARNSGAVDGTAKALPSNSASRKKPA
jgi:hypothetical protein